MDKLTISIDVLDAEFCSRCERLSIGGTTLFDSQNKTHYTRYFCDELSFCLSLRDAVEEAKGKEAGQCWIRLWNS